MYEGPIVFQPYHQVLLYMRHMLKDLHLYFPNHITHSVGVINIVASLAM